MRYRGAYLYVLPPLIVSAAVVLFPIVQAAWLSFTNSSLRYHDWQFIGIDNYLNLFHDNVFKIALWNTVIFTFFTVMGIYLGGFLLAILLNQKLRGVGVVRSLLLIPYILPTVVVALIWTVMLWDSFGALNTMLRQMGLIRENIRWLSSTSLALPSVMLVYAWWRIPLVTLILLAGLKSIPPELYEAAAIDGASIFQKFRHVTFPLLKPISMSVILILTVWNFSHFDIPWLLTQGGPIYSSHLLSIYSYIQAFVALDTGYAAAIADLMLVLLAIPGIVYIRRTILT